MFHATISNYDERCGALVVVEVVDGGGDGGGAGQPVCEPPT